MIIYDFINWLNVFIVLNPFLATFLFMLVGIIIDRLYLRLNPNYTLMKGKVK
tara:strand:+ start:1783 stop:1938 length:156 start_codon:yes stop_codon:yes gene_type:complete